MWFNPMMIALLRSPLHGLLSQETFLITYTGRKSGRQHTVPVNYLVDGQELLTISQRQRTWWRSLQHGAQVMVLFRGQSLPAYAEAFTDLSTVSAALDACCRQNRRYAGFLGVRLDASGQPEPDSLQRAAAGRVVIRTRLTGAKAG